MADHDHDGGEAQGGLMVRGISQKDLVALLEAHGHAQNIFVSSLPASGDVEDKVVVSGSGGDSSEGPRGIGRSLLTKADAAERKEAVTEAEKMVAQLKQQLLDKEKEMEEMSQATAKSVSSIQAFHAQQKHLFDEFVLLRHRYDDNKAALLNVLWEKCSQFHPELNNIPNIEDGHVFIETDQQVGRYGIGALLGEGQFATVRSCWLADEDESTGSLRSQQQWAMKIIKKERITTFASLKRVSNEIEILRTLHSPFVVGLHDVIQTNTMLYIVTEKGGADLFEFFDEHPEGVPEAWAKDIITGILRAVLYCHQQGVCHRDLKPENILLSFDYEAKRVVDIKLCDFGLSVHFSTGSLLTDFCGSPGFFASEMIIHGAYYGDKADVWSVGCIILELVLGHERFCDVWMSAYDYDLLQDKEKFTDEIDVAVASLPEALSFLKNADLQDFITRFLRLHSSERPSICSLCLHSWLGGQMDAELRGTSTPPNFSPLSIDISGDWSPSSGPNTARRVSSPSELQMRGGSTRSSAVNSDILDSASRAVSDRERRMYEEHNQSAHGGVGMGGGGTGGEHQHHHQLHLPPIVPSTPSVVKARKMLAPSPTNADAATSAEEKWAAGGGGRVEAKSALFRSSSTPISLERQQKASSPITTSSSLSLLEKHDECDVDVEPIPASRGLSEVSSRSGRTSMEDSSSGKEGGR